MLKVKSYEVRHGDLEEWCVNKYTCVKRKKLVKVFKRSEYQKAKAFADKVNSEVELNFTL
jgi:pterin-4a-carbinolamine dehydratase